MRCGTVAGSKPTHGMTRIGMNADHDWDRSYDWDR